MRLSEIYTSVQGEGPNVGRPTQFVRFAGCNMRCALWPCDSPYAIYPDKYRHEWETIEPYHVIERVFDGVKHICLTGGEPYIQNLKQLSILVEDLLNRGFTFDIFTNGSFSLPKWAIGNPAVTHVLDWKLRGSGEAETRREERENNARFKLSGWDAIKFTVASKEDLLEAEQQWYHLAEVSRAKFYVGKVWESSITEADVVDYILTNRLPWVLNVQLHKYVWDADAREI